MSTIWHSTGLPSWLGAAPRFSFYEAVQIEAPAPETYARAWREWQKRYPLHVACCERAAVIWQRTKPWYCSL